MKQFAFAIAMAIMALLANASDASAQQRCGYWMQNGTIHIGPPCSRQPHWQHHNGQRHWGYRRQHNQPVYYQPEPRTIKYRAVQQQYVAQPVLVAPQAVHGQICPQTNRVIQSTSVAQNPQQSTGYIEGAPRNAQECIVRGGQVVNNGRGCAGYN